MRLLLISASLFIASLTAAGITHTHKTDNRGVWLEIAQAPVKTRNWKNPYEGQPDAIAAGKKLFRQHCGECHGEDAKGRHAPNLHSAGVKNATPGELAWFLRNGNITHRMPPWAGLPEQRRWQIVSYVKSLGIEPNVSASRADSGIQPAVQ